MSILSKLIYSFNIITIKIPARLFGDIDKIILNFIWKRQWNRIAKTILKNKNKVGEITLLNFNTYNTATVTTIVILEE